MLKHAPRVHFHCCLKLPRCIYSLCCWWSVSKVTHRWVSRASPCVPVRVSPEDRELKLSDNKTHGSSIRLFGKWTCEFTYLPVVWKGFPLLLKLAIRIRHFYHLLGMKVYLITWMDGWTDKETDSLIALHLLKPPSLFISCTHWFSTCKTSCSMILCYYCISQKLSVHKTSIVPR